MNRKFILTSKRRATHTYVIGQPGTGKSRALESWIIQDVMAGHGVGVIDPHGELFQNLLLRLAHIPKVWKRVVIIDPCDPKWVVSFNPLEAFKGQHGERIALFMTDITMKIWGLDTSNAPRMLWLVTNTFLALSELGLSLLDLPNFLLDTAFRESQLARINKKRVRNYFQYEFPKKESAIHQWVTPALNKLGGLLFDPDVQGMFSRNLSLDFQKVMDDRSILLVHIPKGTIGESSSALLGAFIVASLQKAAFARKKTKRRKPFYLYLDEFQNYTTDNIQDILAEARKYDFSTILAHQYLDQLSTEIRSAVLNTAGTIISFRVGYKDAVHLAKEIFGAPDYLQRQRLDLKIKQRGLLPQLSVDRTKEKSNWDSLVKQLTGLKHREFWSKQRGQQVPVKLHSYTMPDIPITKELKEKRLKMLNTSGSRYGKPKQALQHRGVDNSTKAANASKSFEKDNQNARVPLWEA